MKLWLLRPIGENGTAWCVVYDCSYGFVIRAQSEADARNLAADYSGDEGGGAWLDSTLSSCVVLEADGQAEVIIRDFYSV